MTELSNGCGPQILNCSFRTTKRYDEDENTARAKKIQGNQEGDDLYFSTPYIVIFSILPPHFSFVKKRADRNSSSNTNALDADW